MFVFSVALFAIMSHKTSSTWRHLFFCFKFTVFQQTMRNFSSFWEGRKRKLGPNSIKKPFHNLVESLSRDGTGFNYRDFLRDLRLQLLNLQHQQRLVSHLSIGVVHFRQHQTNFGLLQFRLGQNGVQQDACNARQRQRQSLRSENKSFN